MSLNATAMPAATNAAPAGAAPASPGNPAIAGPGTAAPAGAPQNGAPANTSYSAVLQMPAAALPGNPATAGQGGSASGTPAPAGQSGQSGQPAPASPANQTSQATSANPANPATAGQGGSAPGTPAPAGQSGQSGQPAPASPANQTSQATSANPANPASQTSQADADNRPIEDWSKVDLQLGDALVDANVVEGFGQAAIASGLTPAQARAIAQKHVAVMKAQAETRLAAERKILEDAWGRDMPARLQQVELLCQRLERLPGCENFREALERSGGASSAVVVRGLQAIAQALAEDSKGRFMSGGLSGKETALEGIRSVFGLAAR